MLDTDIEASACARNSTTSTCTSTCGWLFVDGLTELYGGLVNKNDVHSLETVLLTTLVHYSCEKRCGGAHHPVNLMETVNLTQKYCAVRTELARTGETYCREQLALTRLDHQLSASWLQMSSSMDVSTLPGYQLPPSPTCAL